jgi:hypothetical protein
MVKRSLNLRFLEIPFGNGERLIYNAAAGKVGNVAKNGW